MTDNKLSIRFKEIINEVKGDSDLFIQKLRQEKIPHLSFSQISAVEFCHYRYYLQYVQMLDPEPIPDYFTKGKIFHQAVASYYKNLLIPGIGPVQNPSHQIQKEYHGKDLHHITNAYSVHLENYWKDCEIIGVEQPFVMTVDPELPPFVGVIDLILRRNGSLILVDHKTGRDFYEDDELQMAIYSEYIQQKYGQANCVFYYDHYRWVNNLNRIRKPAFNRVKVNFSSTTLALTLNRIQRGYEKIHQIKNGNYIMKEGLCFRCPYRGICYR